MKSHLHEVTKKSEEVRLHLRLSKLFDHTFLHQQCRMEIGRVQSLVALECQN